MEKISFKKTTASESTQSPEKRKTLPSDLAIIALVYLTTILTLLDMYSHPHQGLADLERRKMLIEALGPFMRNLGNFGFSSVMAISAVFVKHTINEIFENKLVRKINKHTFLTFIASVMTLNALIEALPKNLEGPIDLSFGVIGTVAGLSAAELVINKFKKAKLTKNENLNS